MISSSMIKSTLKYQKDNYENSYKTIVVLQGQAEKLASGLLEKSFNTLDVKKVFELTVSECKKSRDYFKKIMDDNFSILESMLSFTLFN